MLEALCEPPGLLPRTLHHTPLRLRQLFLALGLLCEPSVADAPERTKRKRPEPRVGELESDVKLDRWRHGDETAKWKQLHLENPRVQEKGTWWFTEFRKKFRVPPDMFEKLYEETVAGPFGDTNERHRGPRRVQLRLKMMAALRILATGAGFDAFEEVAGHDKETQRRFFHRWMKWLSENVVDRYVFWPTSDADVERNTSAYAKLGFPGAIGSVDGTHVAWDKAPAAYQSLYVGKDGYPTLTFNVTVDDRKRVLHVLRGQPGSRNDKNLAHYDEYIQAIRNGLYKDHSFALYKSDGTQHRVKGLYLICDGM